MVCDSTRDHDGLSTRTRERRRRRVLALGLRHRGEEGEQQAAVPGGVVDPERDRSHE